jgi:hypothetical protein
MNDFGLIDPDLAILEDGARDIVLEIALFDRHGRVG